MKKFLSILMIFAVLLSCCACTAKEEGEGAAAPTLDPTSPEAMYSHIDQTTPMDGYYKIWNADGVKNMVNHPDGKFELLCNVDMQGAVLEPIGEFTGTFKGGNFTISNFTVNASQDGNFGFVGINKGQISNLLLSGATFVTDAGAKHIGTLAGINEGTINRCTVTGTLTVETAAADAICGSLTGRSTGDIMNTIVNVDTLYTAEGAATVAGIAGSAEGGKLEFLETNGSLEITGADKKTALFIGDAKDLSVNTMAFVGAANSQDGKLFTNYYGSEENVTSTRMLVRDNSREPEQPHIQEKRQVVVDNMIAMATTTWKLREDMVHSCTCQLSICHGTFNSVYTYYGPPYNHKASSLYRMEYCIDEDGYLKEFVEYAGAKDGYDMYIGSDCSSATLQALLTVGTEVWFTQTQNENPYFTEYGTYPVGPYEPQAGQDKYTNGRETRRIRDFNGEEVMYESYAQVRMGDCVVYWDDGYGHSRVCSSDAVVVRDENGNIDPQYSYILMTEQGVETIDAEAMTYTSWRVNFKYTFANLYEGFYVPFTIKEFITGEFEEVECTLEGGISDSRLGLTTGTIVTNYSIDSVSMVITDDSGSEVYNHRLFATVSKSSMDGSTHSRTRAPYKEFNLTNFATPLQQQVAFKQGTTYHATITAHLTTGDEFVVNDFTFVNGQV